MSVKKKSHIFRAEETKAKRKAMRAKAKRRRVAIILLAILGMLLLGWVFCLMIYSYDVFETENLGRKVLDTVQKLIPSENLGRKVLDTDQRLIPSFLKGKKKHQVTEEENEIFNRTYTFKMMYKQYLETHQTEEEEASGKTWTKAIVVGIIGGGIIYYTLM